MKESSRSWRRGVLFLIKEQKMKQLSVLSMLSLSLLAMILLCSIGYSKASEVPNRFQKVVKIESIRVVLDYAGEKSVLLPDSLIKKVHEASKESKMQCFSYPIPESSKKLWVCILKPIEPPKIVPGGEPAKIKKIEIRISSPIPERNKSLWLNLGDETHAKFQRVGDNLLDFDMKNSTTDLKNINREFLLTALLFQEEFLLSEKPTKFSPARSKPGPSAGEEQKLKSNEALMRPESTRVKLDYGDKGIREVGVSSPLPYVIEGKIFILAGETFSIEFDIIDGRLENARYVEVIKDKNRSIQLTLMQDKEGTRLKALNGFSGTINCLCKIIREGGKGFMDEGTISFKTGTESIKSWENGDPTMEPPADFRAVWMILLYECKFEDN